MAGTIVYEDAERKDTRTEGTGWNVVSTEWKPGSNGYREQQARDLLQAALANWASLTAAQKDRLLRLLVRYVLGRFEGF